MANVPEVFNQPGAAFVLLPEGIKFPPIEKGWQEKGHTFQEATAHKGNVGILAGNGFIGLDQDDPTAFEGLELPTATKWETRPGRFGMWFKVSGDVPAALGRIGKKPDQAQLYLFKDGKPCGEIKLQRTYQVIPPSWKILEGGARGDYKLVNCAPPTEISFIQLIAALTAIGITFSSKSKLESNAKKLEDMGKKAHQRRAESDESRARRYAEAALEGEVKALESSNVGNRNDQLNKSSFALGQFVAAGVLSETEVIRALSKAAMYAGLEMEEIRATIASGLEAGAKHPRDSPEPKRATARTTIQEGMREQAQTDFEHLTEGGNAHRLERIHGDDMRFNHTHKKWFVWDGGRWKVDGNGNAARLAEDVVSMLYIAAANATDSKMRDKIACFAKSTDSRKGINNMLALAANRRKFALTADDFDKDPWLLGAGEVAIDLKTGEAIEPRRSDLITMQAGARYDSFADCPLWKKFLNDIFAGNEDLIKYIKRAVGYCLTGSTSEQIFFFCHGTGANGKSVFLSVLRALLGEYAKQADFSTFLVQRNEKVRNDLAALAGARVITAVEAEEGGRLSMQVLKTWTGGDPITARFLFGENFTFKPQGKIWLAANTKPAITERNYAAWRRVHLIPFNVTIPPEKRDQNLENKLIAELPGILNWALEGLKDYLKVGLKTPEAVAKATAEYRKENDSLESFIAECCETGKLKVCKNSELYPNYVNFCNMSGLSPLSQTKFSPEMNSKPGISSKKSKFGVEWKGIDLRPEWRDLGDCTNPSPLSGGPKGDDLDQNAERSLKSSLREGLCAFESNPSPNQSTDSGDGLSQPVTKGKTEPSKRSVVGGQKEGDEGDSVNILKVGFRTDYRTDWNGKMHDFQEGDEIEVARWRAEAWQKRGIVDIVEASG